MTEKEESIIELLKPKVFNEHTHLNSLKLNGGEVTVYLLGGLKLEGAIVSHDEYTIFITSNKQSRPLMVYKHAIASIQ